MPEIAKLVTLDLAQKKLFVDGQEFPWWINEQGPILNNLDTPGELRSVTLTFFTEDVEVIPENSTSEVVDVSAAQQRSEKQDAAGRDGD